MEATLNAGTGEASPASEDAYEGRLRKYSENLWIFEFFDLPAVFGLGKSQVEAFNKAQSTLKHWLATAKRDGLVVPQPNDHKNYSGKITLRLPKSHKQRISKLAAHAGLSRNELTKRIIEFGLGQMDALDDPTRDLIADVEICSMANVNLSEATRKSSSPIDSDHGPDHGRTWILRVEPSTHLHIACASKQDGVSANTFVVSLVSSELTKIESAIGHFGGEVNTSATHPVAA